MIAWGASVGLGKVVSENIEQVYKLHPYTESEGRMVVRGGIEGGQAGEGETGGCQVGGVGIGGWWVEQEQIVGWWVGQGQSVEGQDFPHVSSPFGCIGWVAGKLAARSGQCVKND